MKSFPSFNIPLSIANRQLALILSQTQTDIEKSKQLQLNILAVCAVDQYFSYLDIETDKQQSDSFDSIHQSLTDTADLMLPNIGKIECRPVLVDQAFMFVPPDVWSDRIGYIAVQFDEAQLTANLLGFVPSVDQQKIPLIELEPLDLLLERLNNLEREMQVEHQSTTILKSIKLQQSDTVSNLGKWLNHTVEAGWQIIDYLLDDHMSHRPEPKIAFRQSLISQGSTSQELIQCSKFIQLNESIDDSQLNLIVGLEPQNDDKYRVRIRLSPTQSPYLIPGLEVSLIDELGAAKSTNQISQKQPYFELKLRLEKGDRFSVRARYADTAFEQGFIL